MGRRHYAMPVDVSDQFLMRRECIMTLVRVEANEFSLSTLVQEGEKAPGVCLNSCRLLI